MQHRMYQEHHLVQHIYFIFEKTQIKNTDINICVKDNFFLHLLNLLKLKSSGII